LFKRKEVKVLKEVQTQVARDKVRVKESLQTSKHFKTGSKI
jgi:hypothetical protein